LLYLRERRGSLENLQVAFVGEASNLCMSWLEAAAVLPIRVVQVCPVGYAADEGHLAGLRAGAAGELQVTHDLESALVDVDLIYTDCWPRGADAEEQRRIKAAFLPYQINVQHLDRLGAEGVFLPCPPVTRGEEVSAEAMRSPRCQNHAAKDKLLHVQNAIMETVAAGELGR
jgi:ornithine carbamoyltransferase